ncbi:MAG: hypothetical protein EA405_00900 [Rhodospirillales bacterium]|nr:MAG: hypothetical protein EA405_00900 [Rhodospirillales bacterium]
MNAWARPFVTALLVLAVAACGHGASDRTEAQALVDRAKWTVMTFQESPEDPSDLFRSEIEQAAGVMVFPRVLRGAFVIGGEGGSGVLLVRDEAGEWSYPAFYTMGSGSLGLQAGAQASEVVLLLRSQRAVDAVIYNQGKFGADLGVTFGTIGAGLQGATTTNLGADILGIARNAGLYGGLSLNGAALVRRTDLNGAYYAPEATPQDIVLARRYSNPNADPLRQALDIR